jgi:hypothetical protein
VNKKTNKYIENTNVLAHCLTPTCFGASEAPSSGSSVRACWIVDQCHEMRAVYCDCMMGCYWPKDPSTSNIPSYRRSQYTPLIPYRFHDIGQQFSRFILNSLKMGPLMRRSMWEWDSVLIHWYFLCICWSFYSLYENAWSKLQNPTGMFDSKMTAQVEALHVP